MKMKKLGWIAAVTLLVFGGAGLSAPAHAFGQSPGKKRRPASLIDSVIPFDQIKPGRPTPHSLIGMMAQSYAMRQRGAVAVPLPVIPFGPNGEVIEWKAGEEPLSGGSVLSAETLQNIAGFLGVKAEAITGVQLAPVVEESGGLSRATGRRVARVVLADGTTFLGVLDPVSGGDFRVRDLRRSDGGNTPVAFNPSVLAERLGVSEEQIRSVGMVRLNGFRWRPYGGIHALLDSEYGIRVVLEDGRQFLGLVEGFGVSLLTDPARRRVYIRRVISLRESESVLPKPSGPVIDPTSLGNIARAIGVEVDRIAEIQIGVGDALKLGIRPMVLMHGLVRVALKDGSVYLGSITNNYAVNRRLYAPGYVPPEGPLPYIVVEMHKAVVAGQPNPVTGEIVVVGNRRLLASAFGFDPALIAQIELAFSEVTLGLTKSPGRRLVRARFMITLRDGRRFLADAVGRKTSIVVRPYHRLPSGSGPFVDYTVFSVQRVVQGQRVRDGRIERAFEGAYRDVVNPEVLAGRLGISVDQISGVKFSRVMRPGDVIAAVFPPTPGDYMVLVKLKNGSEFIGSVGARLEQDKADPSVPLRLRIRTVQRLRFLQKRPAAFGLLTFRNIAGYLKVGLDEIASVRAAGRPWSGSSDVLVTLKDGKRYVGRLDPSDCRPLLRPFEGLESAPLGVRLVQR